MNFGTWLADQRSHESEDGVDFHGLACNPTKLTEYAERHLNDVIEALDRAGNRFPRTYESEEFQRTVWEEHRGAIIEEMVVALRHIGSALNSLGCTDKELERVYGDAPANMPHESGKAALICAECNDPIDEKSEETITSDGHVYCGKKCEESCNQTPEVSVSASDEASGEPEEREKA